MNKKTRITLFLIILLAIIGLNLMIYLHSIDLDCNQCTIKFKNTKVQGYDLKEEDFTDITSWTINITTLAKALENDTCIIKWSRTGGYYI